MTSDFLRGPAELQTMQDALKKFVNEHKGAIYLARVNVEQQPGLAGDLRVIWEFTFCIHRR